MILVLDPYLIPEKGPVEVQIDRAFEIKVTAEEARRQVRWWLREEVSMLLEADPPTLVVGEKAPCPGSIAPGIFPPSPD